MGTLVALILIVVALLSVVAVLWFALRETHADPSTFARTPFAEEPVPPANVADDAPDSDVPAADAADSQNA